MRLEPGEFHVWRASEPAATEGIDALAATLSPDECERASAFRFETDRRRFVFCRGILRELIGRYLTQAPASIAFAYGPRGKPMLADRLPLQFNLAHTNGLSMFAFTPGPSVGVDVESIRGGRDMEAIARQFFHPNEWAAIAALPPVDRQRAFYATWACKEAWLKVEGIGIVGGLDAFEVVLPPSLVGDANLTVSGTSAPTPAWVRLLDAGPGWSSAVAGASRPARLLTWQYQRRA